MATFDPDIKIEWQRPEIEPARLKELMQRSDLRGWLQTIGHLGWFFTTAALCTWLFYSLNADNWPWLLPILILALFLHGTMGPFMGLIAVHELQHRTVFKTRWLNDFFERIYAFISWSDYIWYRHSHAIHHQATCHAKHDGEVVLPVRFSLRWRALLALFAWYPVNTWNRLKLTWQHAKGEIQGDWYHHVLADPKLRKQHQRWAQTLLLGHLTLALTFIISGYWFLIVVFTMGTQYCSWLGFLCGVAQHYGMQADSSDFRTNTRTFTCSPIVGFYYWNMQYHVEHHMFPAVPFYNLPKLRAELAGQMPEAPHGLWATWQEILSIRAEARNS